MRIFHQHLPASLLRKLDPRVRLLQGLAFAVLVVALDRWTSLIAALVLAIGLTVCARIDTRQTLGRLLRLNLFVLFLLALMPLSVPGTAIARIGSVAWSREGVLLALRIGLKANAIMLACGALLLSMEPAHLGFAMTRLGMPAKFTHIFLFMLRYIETIHIEYHRLRHAMKLRGFVPRCSMHALRSLGYLIGMLLVRSMDRADRIVAAMKCRGFCGKLYVLEQFRFRTMDAVLTMLFLCVLGVLAWLEWT